MKSSAPDGRHRFYRKKRKRQQLRCRCRNKTHITTKLRRLLLSVVSDMCVCAAMCLAEFSPCDGKDMCYDLVKRTTVPQTFLSLPPTPPLLDNVLH